jgi:hypothetical protein
MLTPSRLALCSSDSSTDTYSDSNTTKMKERAEEERSGLEVDHGAATTATKQGARTAKALALLVICLAAVRLATWELFSTLRQHHELGHTHVAAAANSTRIAFCAPALFNFVRLDLVVLSQWVAYHKRLGVDEFMLHVMEGDRDEALGPGRPFSEWLQHQPNVLMNVLPGGFKSSCKKSRIGCGQAAAIQHCWDHVKRSNFAWAIFGDIDEYWALNTEGSPGGTADLRAFLQPYNDYFAVNFGKYDFVSSGACTSMDAVPAGLEGFSTIMRRPWRLPSPACFEGGGEDHEVERGLCHGWRARRKAIVNLRKTSRPPSTHMPTQGLPCDMNADGTLTVASKDAEHPKGTWMHKLRHVRVCWPHSLYGSCDPSKCWLNLPAYKARINEWRALPFKANCTIQYSARQTTIQGNPPFYHGKEWHQANYVLDRNMLRWAQMALTTPSWVE